jgi:hypothetical protein
MNPLLLTKIDGKQVVIDIDRVITFEELPNDQVRVSLAAGNGVLTFTVVETMAAVVKAISDDAS